MDKSEGSKSGGENSFSELQNESLVNKSAYNEVLGNNYTEEKLTHTKKNIIKDKDLTIDNDLDYVSSEHINNLTMDKTIEIAKYNLKQLELSKEENLKNENSISFEENNLNSLENSIDKNIYNHSNKFLDQSAQNIYDKEELKHPGPSFDKLTPS